MIDFNRINWLAVLLCVVVGMILGLAWYGFLFTNIWAAGNGIEFTGEGEAMKALKNGKEMVEDYSAYGYNALGLAVYGILLSWLFQRTGTNTWQDGAMLGGGIIGLIGLIGVCMGNLFSQMPFSLSMVDGSYSLVLFAIFGAIIGGWQKRTA